MSDPIIFSLDIAASGFTTNLGEGGAHVRLWLHVNREYEDGAEHPDNFAAMGPIVQEGCPAVDIMVAANITATLIDTTRRALKLAGAQVRMLHNGQPIPDSAFYLADGSGNIRTPYVDAALRAALRDEIASREAAQAATT